jgi:hypothetical protein
MKSIILYDSHLSLFLLPILLFYAGRVRMMRHLRVRREGTGQWQTRSLILQKNMMNLGDAEVLPIFFFDKLIEGSFNLYYCFDTHPSLFLLSLLLFYSGIVQMKRQPLVKREGTGQWQTMPLVHQQNMMNLGDAEALPIFSLTTYLRGTSMLAREGWQQWRRCLHASSGRWDHCFCQFFWQGNNQE